MLDSKSSSINLERFAPKFQIVNTNFLNWAFAVSHIHFQIYKNRQKSIMIINSSLEFKIAILRPR